MPDGNLLPAEIYPLANGYLPGTVPGLLVPGSGLPVWRDMLNLRPHEGLLRFREPVRASAFSAPSYSINTSTVFAVPLWIGEIPMAAGFLGFTSSRFLVITSMDWWLIDAGTFHNITPQHSTGTVTVAGTAVTGAGTNWLARGIKTGDIFEAPDAAGNWARIAAVGSDTSITLATSLGAIGAGSTYRIRRTLVDSHSVTARLGVFVRVLNGDIYVCGAFAGGRGSSTNINHPDGAVLRVINGADGLTSTFNGTDVEYLTSGSREIEVGVDFVGFNFDPVGFDILEDGRLVVGTNYADFATPASGAARVLYSSHLDTAVWTTAPAGQVDLIQRSGTLNAMGRIGRLLTFHFTDGVRLGEQTGQDDPPLAFPQTAATIGACAPRVLRTTPQGELFVGQDRNLHTFDGSRSTPIAEARFWHPLQSYRAKDLRASFATHDEHRSEYSLWIHDSQTGGVSSFRNRTVELRYNLQEGQLTRHSYPFHVHAVSDAPLSIDLTMALFRRSLRKHIVGVASAGNSTTSNLLYVASEDPTESQGDSVPNVDNLSAEQPYVETDDLDLSDNQGAKALERVQVWVRTNTAGSGSEVLSCLAYKDGSTTASVAADDVTKTLAGEKELLYTFFFATQPARLWRIRLSPTSGDTNFFGRIVRVRVIGGPAGDERAAST